MDKVFLIITSLIIGFMMVMVIVIGTMPYIKGIVTTVSDDPRLKTCSAEYSPKEASKILSAKISNSDSSAKQYYERVSDCASLKDLDISYSDKKDFFCSSGHNFEIDSSDQKDIDVFCKIG